MKLPGDHHRDFPIYLGKPHILVRRTAGLLIVPID